MPEQGNLILWDWSPIYTDIPEATGTGIVQSWDVAMTDHDGSSYSVCMTFLQRDKSYYLLDIYRDRIEFPALLRKVSELHARCSAQSVLIEEAGIGIGLIQQLRSAGNVHPIGIKPQGSKVDRMAAESPAIESSRVVIPEKAAWLDELRMELLAFPYGKHDDQVDALSQFLNWVRDHPDGFRVLHVKI